jgi:RNA polymerase sigma-70 factor (ECF subfamily)
MQTDERYTHGLLERLRAGDREAANELFAVHGARLQRALRARLPKQLRALVDEDELVQATLLRSLQILGRFEWRGQGAFLAWLVGIAVNVFREQAAQARRPVEEQPTSMGEVLERDSNSPSRVAERLEDWQLLEEALDQLDEDDRVLVVHRQILEQDYRSLAEDLGISEGAVRTRVSRAMNQLARWIERRDQESSPGRA